MTKYIIKYRFICNGKVREDYAIRTGIDQDVVQFEFIDEFKSSDTIYLHNEIYLLSVDSIEELGEKVDLKTEIEKLKASAKEMLETLEKIKL